MDKKYLSFTQLSMFLRCPRQYEFRYIKGLKIPPSGKEVPDEKKAGSNHNGAKNG